MRNIYLIFIAPITHSSTSLKVIFSIYSPSALVN